MRITNFSLRQSLFVVMVAALTSVTTSVGQNCPMPAQPSDPYPVNNANLWKNSKVLSWTGYKESTLLNADFENKPVDVIIGTNGAADGEPVYLDVNAGGYVRSTATPSKSLEIVDNDDYEANYARFEFLSGREVSSGVVEIRATLWFSVLEDYSIYVREQGSSTKNFLDLYFTPSGTVDIYGATGTPQSYVAGRPYELLIIFNMDAGTYDVIWDGNVMIQDQPHGQYGAGVGAVLFGVTHDPNLLGKMYVDNIWVTTSQSAVDTLLSATFDSKTANAAIGKGGAALGEPISYGPTIGAIVKSTPMSTKSLELVDNSNYAADYVTFELLDSREVTSGRLEVKAQLWFDVLGDYLVRIREQGGSTKNFFDLMMTSNGRVQSQDGGPSEGYQPGRLYDLLIVFDLDAGTYDLVWDGHLMLKDQPHGEVGRGIGRILFGMSHDSDLNGKMYIDNILATHSNDCETQFEVYIHHDEEPNGILYTCDVPYLAVPNLQCGKRYTWIAFEKSISGRTQCPGWSFSTERCECDAPAFKANFDHDVIGALPDLTLSSDLPTGDYLITSTTNASIKTEQATGSLIDKPLVVEQYAGTGSRRVFCYPPSPVTGNVVVSWRSLVRSTTTSFIGCVLRGSNSEIIASLEYRGNGTLTYNSNSSQLTLPVTYTPDVDQFFEISVDFKSHTTNLYINGRTVPYLRDIPFVQMASNLGRFGFELGGTNQQTIAIDDVVICTEVSCCQGTRGNVNCDENDLVDIGDLAILIDHLFVSFPPLCCEEEADLDGDGSVNIADLTILIDYLFISFLPPVPCGTSLVAPRLYDTSGASYLLEYDGTETTIGITSEHDLRGLEIKLKGAGETSPVSLCGDSLNLFYGRQGELLVVGLVDMDGSNVISAGSRQVLRIAGNYAVTAVVGVDLSNIAYHLSAGSKLSQLIPETFDLGQNYPNPFNPTTTLSFRLPVACDVQLAIYNTLGQNVRTLLQEQLGAGEHTVMWDGRSDFGEAVASGVYFYRLESGEKYAVRKMMLLK